MSFCRICLASNPDKKLCDLHVNKDPKTYIDIMLFCLEIKIKDVEDQKKLCSKCFKKILSFYKFKSLALKNDSYLKSINLCKVEVNSLDVPKLESNLETTKGNLDSKDKAVVLDYLKVDVSSKDEEEVHIKEEIIYDDVMNNSDDEMLSVIKTIKYEYTSVTIEEDCKENAPCNKKRRKKIILPKSKTKKEKLICPKCGKLVFDISQHMRLHKLDKNVAKIYSCKICDRKFQSASGRNKHQRIRHKDKEKCQICGKEVYYMKQHVLVTHNTHKLPYVCAVCGRRCAFRGQLEDHMISHTRDKKFECDICQKKFGRRPLMLLHKRQVHDKEKSHLCQFCSKSFFKKDHLQIHIRVHTKEKPYACKECNKAFMSKTILKKHMVLHTGAKNYSCSLCDMKFATSSYVSNHMKSHTKIKKYPCGYCGVKFHRSDHRNRHENTAHLKHLSATKDT